MFGASRSTNVFRGLVLMLFVIVVGTWGLILLEGFPLLDALYMTIITISTVGFGEVRELSGAGHVFVIFLIIGGLSVMTYTLGALAQYVIEGQFGTLLGRRRMERQIASLKGHYVICGHGRMGRILCAELQQEGASFVVVEGKPEEAEELRELGYLVIEGDATHDEVLQKSGIERARGLVAVVSSDVDNLYIVLSAREMTRQENPRLYILARASDQQSMHKLRRAGADRVISPYQIGGMRLVQALLRPAVYDFVEVVTSSSGMDLMIEEMPVGRRSKLVGHLLRDSGIRQHYDLIIVGIKKDSGRMVFNPGPDEPIEAGDVLIVLGDRTQTGQLRAVLA